MMATAMADEKQLPVESNGSQEADDLAVGDSQIYIDPTKESKMLLKFDGKSLKQSAPRSSALAYSSRGFQFYAIGLLGLFYMMAILDRSNLGNAQVAGLEEDLSLVGNQFGTAVTLLYVFSRRYD